ncbi:ATP-dependent DNA helicase [Flectobacillus roseus]|uniref:AAA family ATPase n=1 Tax=Flectobacillus roseus TaxID=502259 RepID=A0ABT6Y7M1_9BACT|nr:AAA family ATPase [Flectobacillus roseus]MDI9859567.1 AAA family ATPase [Flectobacillus roseus]MDI9868911.1 AAA family ATPase [Flectobacillus roseus]
MAEEQKTPSFLLRQKFPFEPTVGQVELFQKMEKFILNTDDFGPLCFLLKGYAGTGKTTVISTIIKVLPKFGYKSVLLAPTGRAAKVMSNYSKKTALTIHKKIYRQVANQYTGSLEFQRQNNYATNTIFIIDESSMISDDAEFGTAGLLTDLMEYVFTHPELDYNGNKIIFVGDTAQLPPVGKFMSPALEKVYMEGQFHLGVLEQELTEVMRQDAESGILYNATQLRSTLSTNKPKISFVTKGYRDFYKMTGEKLEDGLNYAYRKFGRENTIILTRSNKTAVLYNRYIRQQIFALDDELSVGDLLMIVRNNYHWLGDDSPAGFLANGDFVEVMKIRGVEEMHGFRFATLYLRLLDYEDHPEIEAKVLLSTLYSNNPSLNKDESKALYDSVALDYEHITNKKDRIAEIRKDPYLNALQVKFAYALTCHKSQGGQWNAVFVEQGYLTDEQINEDFVRWLYTGITRATHEVFLVNFHNEFFD